MTDSAEVRAREALHCAEVVAQSETDDLVDPWRLRELQVRYIADALRAQATQAVHDYHICPACGWEDDPVQYDHPDSATGANECSLNEIRRKLAQATQAEEERPDVATQAREWRELTMLKARLVEVEGALREAVHVNSLPQVDEAMLRRWRNALTPAPPKPAP